MIDRPLDALKDGSEFLHVDKMASYFENDENSTCILLPITMEFHLIG